MVNSWRILKYNFLAVKCNKAYGMQNGRIGNNRVTASSEWNAALGSSRARLMIARHGAKLGSWCVNKRNNNNRQYLQIDLGRVRKVTMIATQGRQDVGWFVRQYYVKYSQDGYHWAIYSHRNSPKVYNCYCKVSYIYAVALVE